MEVEPRRVPPSYFEGLDKKKYPEVLFPSNFTQVHPWGESPTKWESQIQTSDVEGLKNMEVPIVTLVHVTHNAQASEIRKEFKFKVRQKFGKVDAFDGRPCGESFRFDLQGKEDADIQPWDLVYVQIPDTEPVFPGFYSWWSIDYSEIPGNEQHRTFTTDIWYAKQRVSTKGMKVTVPEYLETDPRSRYGNRGFFCNFSDLLTAYAESRGKKVGDICIRKGGTLRYKQEICYVLIICIDSDKDRRELKDFELLQPESKQFHMNGLIDESGKIVDRTVIPTFHTEYIVKQISRNHEYGADKCTTIPYSYETAAFAFYFPRESIMTVGKCSEKGISHYPCIRKQPPRSPDRYAKWKCPNDVDYIADILLCNK